MKHPTTWEDMSNYLVHFTTTLAGVNDYDTMMSILSGGNLEGKQPFGIGRKFAPDIDSQVAVCFSEIPPGYWARLVNRRKTKYGIGFAKDFLVSKGGGPIWYAWKDTPYWKQLVAIMNSELDNPDAPIWSLTAMIDAPGNYGPSKYEFDWEREWRYVGKLSFAPKDVAFLLIPEELHAAAGSFFDSVHHDNLGPAYFCPLIDPLWSREQILDALS